MVYLSTAWDKLKPATNIYCDKKSASSSSTGILSHTLYVSLSLSLCLCCRSFSRSAENCIYTKGDRKSRTYVIHHKMSKRSKRISMSRQNSLIAIAPLARPLSLCPCPSPYFCKPKCSLTYQRESAWWDERGTEAGAALTEQRGSSAHAASRRCPKHLAGEREGEGDGRQAGRERERAHTHVEAAAVINAARLWKCEYISPFCLRSTLAVRGGEAERQRKREREREQERL